MEAVDWLPPLAVFAASLMVGALMVWRARASARKRARDPEAEPLAIRDLLGKRDVLIQQLREQEDTAAKRTPEQLARERYALELEAARILHELDTRGASGVPPQRKGAAGRATATAAAPVSVTNPALRGFLWGTASMAAVGLLLFLVFRSARPREQGGSVTGETPMGRAGNSSESSGPASADAQEPELNAAVARNPEDVGTSRRVAGVVDLDATLRGKLAPGAVVWVIVREAGVEKGPPVAVQGFPASAFPFAFSIGEADSMVGERFPEKVRIEARVDSDGDPLTRDPSDPSARLDGVRAGATNLRLVMTR